MGSRGGGCPFLFVGRGSRTRIHPTFRLVLRTSGPVKYTAQIDAVSQSSVLLVLSKRQYRLRSEGRVCEPGNAKADSSCHVHPRACDTACIARLRGLH